MDNNLGAVIKVIGVGGCGSNAVDHMIGKTISGVEFISMNTDIQALNLCHATSKLSIGQTKTRGLGAGADPEVGRNSASESREDIIKLLKGADMVFIAAGMGGGTGTGAAPVVAEIAKELGILTVAVVTKPFTFEGMKKLNAAENGLNELKKNVDSLIIIPNDKILEVLGDDISTVDAYREVNGVLHDAVAGIAEVINCPGHINVDFADVKTIMSEMGMAMMGTSMASGEGRAMKAASLAVSSPLLDNSNLTGARGILVNITGSSAIRMREINEIMNTIRQNAAPDATIILGQVIDDSMGDDLRVTLIATGLDVNAPRITHPNAYQTASVQKMNNTTAMDIQNLDVDNLDVPAIMRRSAGNRGGTVGSGLPSFLNRRDRGE